MNPIDKQLGILDYKCNDIEKEIHQMNQKIQSNIVAFEEIKTEMLMVKQSIDVGFTTLRNEIKSASKPKTGSINWSDPKTLLIIAALLSAAIGGSEGLQALLDGL